MEKADSTRSYAAPPQRPRRQIVTALARRFCELMKFGSMFLSPRDRRLAGPDRRDACPTVLSRKRECWETWSMYLNRISWKWNALACCALGLSASAAFA